MPRPAEQDLEVVAALLDQTQAYLEYRSRGLDPPHPLPAAWDRFYDYYAPRLRAVLARWDLTAAERDDCFQEVWTSVLAHLPQFTPNGALSLSTWLITVARNKGTDSLRRRRLQGLECLIGDTLFETGHDPAIAYERQELREQVRAVLAELSVRVSARSYQVLYLRRIEGRPVPEIAAALGLTPEQVRLRDHRMRRRFRELFERSMGREDLRVKPPSGEK